MTGVLFSYQMSEQISAFHNKQRKKEKQRRHEERTRVLIVFSIGAAAVYGLIASGYIENPLADLHQDTSISVDDGQSQTAVQLEK